MTPSNLWNCLGWSVRCSIHARKPRTLDFGSGVVGLWIVVGPENPYRALVLYYPRPQRLQAELHLLSGKGPKGLGTKVLAAKETTEAHLPELITLWAAQHNLY